MDEYPVRADCRPDGDGLQTPSREPSTVLRLENDQIEVLREGQGALP